MHIYCAPTQISCTLNVHILPKTFSMKKTNVIMHIFYAHNNIHEKTIGD